MTKDYIVSQPINRLCGNLRFPGDKSISHRALILSAVAEGTTSIHGCLDSLDCLATMRILSALGVKIEHQRDEVQVEGVGLHGLQAPQKSLDFGNSGTAIRLMAGLLCAQDFPSTLYGDTSLNQRPMRRIVQPLRAMGADIKASATETPPLLIQPVQNLHGIDYTLEVASAQLKSCLLLAGIYAKGKTVLSGAIDTRNHTENMLKNFAYPVECNNKCISIEGGHALQATAVEVPGDISSAAFFMVAACLAKNVSLTLENVGVSQTRDGVIRILRAMGAKIELTNQRDMGNEPVADIQIHSSSLTGIDIPQAWVANAIDEFPVLFIAAAGAKGVTRLCGATELKIKESNRITAMAEGLRVCGIEVKVTHDGMSIVGGTIEGGEVSSYHDHRVAMAFLVAGAISQNGVMVKDCANIQTSFPDFSKTANAVGMNIQEVV